MARLDGTKLGMMAVLKDCLELIPKHHGDEVDLAQLPEDDDVYSALQRADTVGMFQVESRAQMASLPRNYPKRFYDVVVQVAIIRPGPIVGKMMHPYMRRRQGNEEITYPHPSLEPVLKRTLGVPLFQEQLLRMAMTVANFTGAEAEEGRVVFTGQAGEYLYNPIGVVHGGYAMTLLDSALGCAVQTMLAKGEGYTSLETSVNFVRPITSETGRVRCEATILHLGGRIATAEGKLTAQKSGKLLAHGTTTCLIFRP